MPLEQQNRNRLMLAEDEDTAGDDVIHGFFNERD